MLLYRAELDADITLTNGGRLRARSLLVDVPHADVTHPEIAACAVASLGLREVDRVELTAVRIFGEPATSQGKSQQRIEYVDLSHVVAKEGAETRLTSPHDRHPDGTDLAGLPLGRLADLPAVVVRVDGPRVDASDLEPYVLAGRAVLLHTGADRHWGTPAYDAGTPSLTDAGAQLLADRGAALIGIDAAGIDAAGIDAAGIPVVANLTNLGELPPLGARFTAVPPRIAGSGSAPVRAFAAVPWFEPHDHTRSAGWLPTADAE